jgi:hypothetical protein
MIHNHSLNSLSCLSASVAEHIESQISSLHSQAVDHRHLSSDVVVQFKQLDTSQYSRSPIIVQPSIIDTADFELY